MKPFIKYSGRLMAVMNDNIDTDILIPKQYLKTVKRTGFSDFVFSPWRYNEDGNVIEDFPLNMKEYSGATILVTGENFGCGSSREHAAWALQDYGFRVIIAGGYSDIFYNNWLNNGNVPIILPREDREELSKLLNTEEIEIDLEKQIIKTAYKTYSFDFPSMWKERLMAGNDSIDITLKHIDKIVGYEKLKG